MRFEHAIHYTMIGRPTGSTRIDIAYNVLTLSKYEESSNDKILVMVQNKTYLSEMSYNYYCTLYRTGTTHWLFTLPWSI